MPRLISWLFFVAVLLYGSGVVAVWAAEPDLKRVRKSLAELQSVQGQFVQHSFNRAVGSSKEAMGEVWIERPDRVRWHFTEPSEQDVLISGGEMWVYSPELAQVVIRRLGPGDLERTPLAFLAGIAALEELYEMKGVPGGDKREEVHVLLTPKEKGASFQSVSLRFKSGDLTLAGLEIVDQLGNLTAITFHGLKTNQRVDPAHFTLTLPPGTQRIRQSTVGSGQ